MKTIQLRTQSLLAILWLSATAALAQSTAIQSLPERDLNRFGASFRMAFDVDVEFSGSGAFTPPGLFRQTPAGDPWNYDDGYVLTDSSGNSMGYTRYWGYEYNTQLPGDGTILMHRSSSSGVTSKADDEPRYGGELTYHRDLGGEDNWRWGLESALNYLWVSVRESSPLPVGYSQLTDIYPLPELEGGGFVNPPPAPHYQGPDLPANGDTVLVATPAGPPAINSMTATLTGRRELDADIFGLRLGPYLEVYMGENLTLAISGGFALAYVQSDFSFSEALSVAGVPAMSGSGSHHDWQPGGYASANLIYKLSREWGIFAGAQYQNVGKYSHTENGRKATLDLSHTLFVVVGASFSF